MQNLHILYILNEINIYINNLLRINLKNSHDEDNYTKIVF